MSLSSVTGPDGSISQVEMNDAVVVHAVDQAGAYLGLVDARQAPAVALGPPPAGDHWRWDFKAARWVRDVPLAETIAAALQTIDEAAGTARMRYVTDVAGQSAVYIRKAEQARQYAAAGFTGTVPPYLAAEAAAMGVTPEQLARQVLTLAALWDDQLSPAIEAARMAGKRAAGAAKTAADVQTTTQATLDALNAI